MSKIASKAPISAIDLVLCLSGEHLVDPALIVDTIKSNAGLWAKVREYGKGNSSYESVSESLVNYL